MKIIAQCMYAIWTKLFFNFLKFWLKKIFEELEAIVASYGFMFVFQLTHTYIHTYIHAHYRTYLYKYDHDVDEAWPECRNERETAEYVFFTCPRCVDQWNCLERIGFQVTTNNIVNLMLTSCDNWSTVCVFTKRLSTQRLTEGSTPLLLK